jgi:ABC-2 type transport system permease protein
MGKVLVQCKREFWECRASFIRTPMVMGLILMVLLLLGVVPLQSKIGHAIEQANVNGELSAEFMARFADGSAVTAAPDYLVHGLATVYSLFVLVLLLVLAFYFADSLYGDRRDQSILFWKSMPVSEPRNVFCKLGTGLAGVPLFYGAAAVATGAFFILVFAVYAKVFWNLPVPGVGSIFSAFFSSVIGLALGWVLMSLWLLPVVAWLLFSSAVARKAPFLIALGIPLGLMVLEGWVFGSINFLAVVKNQFASAFVALQALAHNPGSLVEQILLLLTAPAAWLGLVVSAALIVAAIWLRINRWEI